MPPSFKYFNSKVSAINTDTRTILSNSFALLVIQGTNFILPLVLLPYLVNTLGVEKFGLISIAQSLVSFWIIFADYGFNISATRDIALFKNDKNKLSQIAGNTLKTKILLAILTFCLHYIITSSIPSFSKYSTFYLLSFIMVIGQSLVPTWFFQGIEKMQFLTYINFISKLLFTVLIFLFVKQQTDYLYVTVFYGLGNLLAGIIGVYLMYSKFQLSFRLFEEFDLLTELKKGAYLFLSNLSINTYLNLNIIILGYFAGETVAGFYSIAEKVIYAVKMLITIFFQATFPKICQLKEKGQEYILNFFKIYFFPFFTFITIACLILFLMADQVTVLLAKSHIKEVSSSIRLLSVVPVIVCLNIPAYQSLLAYDFQKSYMMILIIGSLLNIFLSLLLVKPLHINGTIASIISTETFITVGLYSILHFKHNQYSILKYYK